jgi:possible adhesion exoprotein
VEKMSTNKKIKRVLNKIVGRIDIRNKEDRDWYNDVKDKASTFKTNEEKLEYLQGILDKLKKNDGEAASEATKSNTWPAIALGVALFILVVGGAALYFSFLAPKSASASNNTVATSSVANSNMDLPKEDFEVIDYKVDGDAIVYNRAIANMQHKVFANGSAENTLSANAESAVNEMVQYMSHNATALKEKAMAFGIVNSDANVKDWLEKKDGKVRYNEKGKDIYYQTKAFLSRSRISSKKMEEGSNYYTTGVNDKGDVVISRGIQDLSGQEYVEVSNPKDSTEKYRYCVLIYCGNTVMQSNNIPGIPTEKIEIPKPKKPNEPDKPGEPNKPGKPSEGKVSPKDPGKDPANQGKAPVGGGQNDGSSNGSETSQAKLPESYSAPAQSSSSTSGQTAPSQDARVSEPSQWSGDGKITDSNGTTTVADNGSVSTPDGRKYDGLVGQSAPSVEAGGNGVTTPSSSANFTGSSMSQPGIDD